MKQDLIFDVDGLVQGNNLSTLPITIKNKGAVMDILGAIVRVAIKHGGSLFTKQAVITDAANGKCEVSLTREDLFGAGSYFYQPTITFPDGREFSGGIDRFNVTGKLSGPPPTPVPNGIDLSRLGISSSGRLTIDGVEQIGGSGGGGGTVPSNVILFEEWTMGELVTIDTGTTQPPADTTAPVLTISPNGGNFASTQGVTMTTNETADIYYTLDGSAPTTASTKYTAALSINATTTLKAFARDASGNSSAVQIVTFTKDVTAPADTTAPVVTASPAAGTYTSAQSVTLSANETATIYYTTNGTTPTTASNVYSSPISIGATTNLQYMAKDAAGNQSTPVSASYTINIPQADTTAPVLTMTGAATFTDTQTVNMSANETADIWYTVDGSDPVASGTRVKYSAPVTLTATTTVKAYAVDTAGNSSAVQTVTYTKQSNVFTGFTDNFNRADNTTSIGTSDTGHTWAVDSGTTYGISSNQLIPITNTNWGKAIVDLGYSISNFEAELKFGDLPAGFQLFLRDPATAGTKVSIDNLGGGNTYKGLVASVNSETGNTTFTIVSSQAYAPGDKLRVVHKPDGKIEVYLSRASNGYATETLILTATSASTYAKTSTIGYATRSDNPNSVKLDYIKVTPL